MLFRSCGSRTPSRLRFGPLSTKIGFGIRPDDEKAVLGDLVSLWLNRHKLLYPFRGSLNVQLIVNGESQRRDGPGTVADLVASLGLDPRKVAVERNLEIVPRSLHATTALADGDRIEIVQFVGGG